MKMKSALRVLSTVVLSAMMLSSLAGCASTPASTSTPASESTSASTEASEPKAEPVTITWFNHNDNDTKQAWMQFCVDKFNETHPEVTVNIETVGYDSYVSLLKTKIAGEDTPDIFDLTTRVDILDFVENGYVADLTNEPFMENVTTAGTDNMNVDGKLYGAFPEVTLKVVTYNKTLFDEKGYEVPVTTDELYALCDKMLADGVYPFGYGLADGWPIWATFDIDSIPSLYEDDLESDAKRRTGELLFAEDQAFLDLMTRTYERYQYAQPDPFGTDQDTVRTMMANGEIAMIAGGAWELGDTGKKNPDIELGFFALPRSNDAEDTVLTIQGQGGYMVAEESANKDVAMDLYEVMFSEESMVFYQETVGAISTFKNLKVSNPIPAFAYANEMMSAGKVFSNSNMMATMPPSFGDFQANQMSEFLMSDTMDVETLAKNYDEELARLAAAE